MSAALIKSCGEILEFGTIPQRGSQKEPVRWAALPTCQATLLAFPHGSNWRSKFKSIIE
ncbi:MAG: hypothetical protein KME50_11675 [Nostoc desertorum CM1-VF14]|nr:hypothetical protein [Nostoc desertorum CM1-VF14]